jgi:hypothetical protein
MREEAGLSPVASKDLPASFRDPQCFLWALELRGELRRSFYSSAVEGRIIVDVDCLRLCQGPPGHLHGGLIASLHDEAMALATRHGGRLAVTGWLKVEYEAPTPFPASYRIESWVAESNSLSVLTKSRMTDSAGLVMNSASARFVWVP